MRCTKKKVEVVVVVVVVVVVDMHVVARVVFSPLVASSSVEVVVAVPAAAS